MSYSKTTITNMTLVRDTLKDRVLDAATVDGFLAALSATFVHNVAAADHITGTGLEVFVADRKIKVVGSVSNDGIYTIASSTTNDITLIATDVLVSEGPTATVSILGIEEFEITPTKGQDKMIIEIEVADTHGLVAASLGAGGQFWPSAALAWECPQNKTTIMHVSDIGRFMIHVPDTAGVHNPDVMVLTLVPIVGKRLTTDHAAKVGVIELP